MWMLLWLKCYKYLPTVCSNSADFKKYGLEENMMMKHGKHDNIMGAGQFETRNAIYIEDNE